MTEDGRYTRDLFFRWLKTYSEWSDIGTENSVSAFDLFHSRTQQAQKYDALTSEADINGVDR